MKVKIKNFEEKDKPKIEEYLNRFEFEMESFAENFRKKIGFKLLKRVVPIQVDAFFYAKAGWIFEEDHYLLEVNFSAEKLVGNQVMNEVQKYLQKNINQVIVVEKVQD